MKNNSYKQLQELIKIFGKYALVKDIISSKNAYTY